MKALILPPTRNTPSIFFEPRSGRFEMSGISVPENASEYYQPVFDWLSVHLPHLAEGSTFQIRLSYFNSTSLKSIFHVLKLIKEATLTGPDLKVQWTVEEEDEFMQESAELFMDLLDMEFEMIHVPNEGNASRAAG